MKIPFLLPVAICLFAIAAPARSEDASSPVPSSRRIKRTMPIPPSPTVIPPSTPSSSDEVKLTRFDLNFPGGTPAELAAAISKAMGRHLNLIIPAEQADTRIMPITVDGVTVPYLFAAITRASVQRILVGSRSRSEYRDVGITFSSESPVSDETVWSFSSTAPTAQETAFLAEIQAPESVCRYFQLAPYLENYSIEDITTAIQTGWKMAKVEPMPQLSFHRETQLLIAVGPEASVKQIPDVLNQLQRNRGPALQRITKLQAELASVLAKKDGDWQGRARELSAELHKVAAQQKANEAIDDPGQIYTGNPAPPPKSAPAF